MEISKVEEYRTGIVSRFIIEKNFGFIKDIESGDDYYFFLDKKEQIDLRRKGHFPIALIRKGDILNFNLQKSRREVGKEEAYNLIFIENPQVELIKLSIENGISRFGTIEKMNDIYYLTDKEIDITFPVKILHVEKDNIDFDCLDKSLIEYSLEQRKNPTKIYAKLKCL